MSNNSPAGDRLADRLTKLQSAAQSIERLAAEYHAALRPVREALQAVADAPLDDRDQWAGEFTALARRLSEIGLADLTASLESNQRWGHVFDGGEPGRALAGQAFCAALVVATADGSPPVGFFATLDKHSFITADEATREVCTVLSRIFYIHIDRTVPRFARDYKAIRAEVGADSETARDRLEQCGISLSDEAAAAVRDCYEWTTGMRLYDANIRPTRETLPPAEPSSDSAQYARFLELHALATAQERHQVPLATHEGYLRLLTRFGVYRIDSVLVGPPDPTRVPNCDPILNTDCIPVPGTKPLVCPRSSPKLPVELLPRVEGRFRTLSLVGPDQTILWVGRQARMDTLCMYRNGCGCFADNTTQRPTVTAEGEGGTPPTEPAPIPDDFADLHPLLQFRRVAEAIRTTAPADATHVPIESDFWRRWGDPAERHATFVRRMHELADAAVTRIGLDRHWEVLGPAGLGLRDYLSAVICCLAPNQLADLATPTRMADRLARSDAALSHLRPVFDIIQSLLNERTLPAERTRTEKGRKQKRIPRDEAEVLVRKWLATHAKDNPDAVTRDQIAAETGVSAGGVSATAAWGAFDEARKERRKPSVRQIPLTDKMQAAIPADCAEPEELAELIREQEAEKAEDERRHGPS